MKGMTEQVAKTKWCPFARMPGIGGLKGEGIAINRSTEDTPKQQKLMPRCIGSACMAWRETKPVQEKPGGIGRDIISPAEGCCGLAGKP